MLWLLREHGHDAAHHKEEEQQHPDGNLGFPGPYDFSFHESRKCSGKLNLIRQAAQ
jgi:hypothetical protein